MTNSSTAVHASDFDLAPDPETISHDGAFGGLVGSMLNDIQARMAQSHPTQAMPQHQADSIHDFSVACGYLSLIMGSLATTALIYHCFA